MIPSGGDRSHGTHGFSPGLTGDTTPVSSCVPRKIRELRAELERAGFVDRGGKGSHRKFRHPSGAQVVLSGQSGDDAHRYQERLVKEALHQIEQS